MSEWGDLRYYIILMGVLVVLGDLWLRVYRMQSELRKWHKEWREQQKESRYLPDPSDEQEQC